MRVVGLGGALEVVEQGAWAGTGLRGALYRRLPACAPPQAKAQQGGAGQYQCAQLPQPQAVIIGGGDDGRCRRGVHHQAGVHRHVHGARRQAGAFQMIFVGVPPHHFHGGQFQLAGAGRHQGFAVFTAAGQAAVAGTVSHHWLVGVAAQAVDLGAGQRRQLCAGQAFGLHGKAAGQGVADLHVVRRGVPAFAQGQAARGQPGGVGGVGVRFGFDRQGQGRRADMNHLARLGALQGVFLGRSRFHQGSAEGLRRNHHGATVLRVEGVAGFDHAMADAVDDLLIGA